MDDVEESDQKKRQEPGPIGWWWPIIVLAAGALLYYLIYLNDHALPKAISMDEIRSKPHLFSGERSKELSMKLQNLGPRVVGDDVNEIATPKLIEDEIDLIIRNANSNQYVFRARQKGSGGYLLEYNPPVVNMYDNIQNVIAQINGSDGTHSVLLNCHYDSVPTAKGASDDAISCTAMLEIIRVLSVSPERLKHNIVFLFNGAEESQLQASHLFLNHTLSKSCRIVINLEAAGLGGRNVLFQSGPNHSWLFKYYSRHAPHPHGQVLGEEMFQKGIIPSDSDFRVFRDFGNMPGLDFAFWRNGYIYHTKYDNEDYMPVGSHQNIGDNTLAIVRAYGNAPELDNLEAHAEGKMVYYDYLGWFMISYSVGANIGLNVFAIVLGIASIVAFIGFPWQWSVVGELGISILARIISVFVGIGVVAIIALIVDAAAKLVMPWYSSPWLIFPIYWCPCLIIYILIPYITDYLRSKKHDMSITRVTQMNLIAAQVPWIIILLVTTSMGIRSSSLFFLLVLSSAVANLVIHLTPLARMGYHWIWVYFAIHVPALLFNMYLIVMCYMFFIPIFGRSGIGNFEMTIAILTTLFIFYIMSFAIPLMTLVRKPWIIMALLGLFSFLMIIIALASDVGHPYKVDNDGPRPLRYWILHTHREFRDENSTLRRVESGFFINNLDTNCERTIPSHLNATMRLLKSDCESELFCGLPLYNSRMIKLSENSNWIPAGKPIQPVETDLILENGRPECDRASHVCHFSFLLHGPDRKTLTFSPRQGAELNSWSLPSEIAHSGEWNGNPAYFIHIVHGRVEAPYPVTLSFNVTLDQLNGSPVVDIGLAGNHLHHDTYQTDEFKEFMNKFPDWVQITPIISAYKFYVF